MSLKKRSLVMMAALVLPRILWAQYTDVPQGHWAHDAVHKITEAGILSGKVDGQFHGSKAATRYDLAVALAKMLAEVENAWIAQGQSPDDLVPYIEQINLYVADEIDRLKSGQRELTAWMNEIRARLERMEEQMAHSEHRQVAVVHESCSESKDCHDHEKGPRKVKKGHEDHKTIRSSQTSPKKRATKRSTRVARAEKKSSGVMGWIHGIFADDDDDDGDLKAPRKRSLARAPVTRTEPVELAAPPVDTAAADEAEPAAPAPAAEPVKVVDKPKKRSQAPVRSRKAKYTIPKRSTASKTVVDPAPIFQNASTKSTVAVKSEAPTVVAKAPAVEDEEEEEVEAEETSVTDEKKTISLSEKSRQILQSYRERKKK